METVCSFLLVVQSKEMWKRRTSKLGGTTPVFSFPGEKTCHRKCIFSEHVALILYFTSSLEARIYDFKIPCSPCFNFSGSCSKRKTFNLFNFTLSQFYFRHFNNRSPLPFLESWILVMALTKCARGINELINCTGLASIRYYVLNWKKFSLDIWVSKVSAWFSNSIAKMTRASLSACSRLCES